MAEKFTCKFFHYHCNCDEKIYAVRCEVENCDKPDICTFDEAMPHCICACDCWFHELDHGDFHYHCYDDCDGEICMGCETDDCCESKHCKFTPCYKEECGEWRGDDDEDEDGGNDET